MLQLDRTLPLRRQLELLRRKLALRVGLVRRLAKSSCGAVKKNPTHSNLQPFALLNTVTLRGVVTTTLFSSTSPSTTHYAW